MSVIDEKQCHTMPCDQSALDQTEKDDPVSFSAVFGTLEEDWFAPDSSNAECELNVSFSVTLKDTAQIKSSNSQL